MNYDRLLSFGCSFTEGGGLNDPNYQKYLRGEDNFYKEKVRIKKEYHEYANYHSYPGYLSRKLNCPFINFGESKSSNECIFQKVYETIEKFKDERVLVTIQTTLLSRIQLHVIDENKTIQVNGFYDLSSDVENFYKLYITKFFDYNFELTKLLRNIDLYKSFLKNKKVNFVFIIYDHNNSLNIEEVVNFENLSLKNYVEMNKLRICDLPNIPFQDPHFSEQGNEIISDRIYQHIKKIYD